MSVSFHCKCGRWVRMPDDSPSTRCPECLRTLRRPNLAFLWWALGSVAGVFALLAVAASVLPRSPAVAAVAEADEPAAAPLPVVAPPPAKLAEAVVPDSLPLPPRPQPAEPPVVPAPAPPPVVLNLPDPPRVGKLVAEPAGKYKVGDTFVQQVVVSRASAFGAFGVVSTEGAEYALTSTLEVTAVNDDGSMAVTQTVQTGKLIDASADMKESLADALKKAEGSKFQLAVGPTGVVTDLKGLADPLQIMMGRDAERPMIRLWSVLDADAWKELAGLTFFQPDVPGVGEKWTRGFSHDWGPLGSWTGRTDYLTARKPEQNGDLRTDYVHVIAHTPAKGKNTLPFTVNAVAFPQVSAGGGVRYNPDTHRVVAAEEKFHVRGGVSAGFGGSDATVEVEERQHFRVNVSEVVAKQLVGQRPKK